MSKKVILYPHGGSGNHGCEALVRTIASHFNKDTVTLFSSERKQDIQYGIADICNISDYQTNIRSFSIEHLELMLRYHLKKDKMAYELIPYYHMTRSIRSNDIAVSFGGDNYCYKGMVYQLRIIDKELDRRKIKRVLWGASVENIEGIEEDIAGYQIISARESLSYELIKRVNPNTVLYPDPAFVLQTEKCDEVDFENNNGYVGINISPMIIENEKKAGIVLNNYINLIRFILRNTEMSVLLIPHVVWEKSNDLVALQHLASYFDDNRIIICSDHNCMQQKYLISKCRFMVAARTHASIAAYSSHVPTLVVGYSIKAKGIAKDLFGNWENYVRPSQEMVSEYELVDAFAWLIDNEIQIREHYRNIMPAYLEKCNYGLIQMARMIQRL